MAVIYSADIYCEQCGEDIKRRVIADRLGVPVEALGPNIDDLEAEFGFDDERNYDSDEYPKYCDDDEESDSPQHCGSLEDCLDPEVLDDGSKVGHFFRNALTTDGEDYVKDAIREGGAVADLWHECYDYIDISYSWEEAANEGYIELVLSDRRGVYIPRDFIEAIEGSVDWKGISDEDKDILRAGPDHEYYWDAWNDVEQNAVWTDPATGHDWTLYQDGDLFLVCTACDICWD